MYKLFCPIVALVALTAGCGSSHDDDHTHEGTASAAVCPTTQTLTYENFGKGFMQSYCLRCHSENVTGAARNGAPADHNFDHLDEIQGLKEHIDEHAAAGPTVVNTEMPPDAPLPTVDERRKLGEWLACDAP